MTYKDEVTQRLKNLLELEKQYEHARKDLHDFIDANSDFKKEGN